MAQDIRTEEMGTVTESSGSSSTSQSLYSLADLQFQGVINWDGKSLLTTANRFCPVAG